MIHYIWLVLLSKLSLTSTIYLIDILLNLDIIVIDGIPYTLLIKRPNKKDDVDSITILQKSSTYSFGELVKYFYNLKCLSNNLNKFILYYFHGIITLILI